MDMEVDLTGRRVMVAIPCVDGTIDVRIGVELLKASHMFAQHGVQMAVVYLSYCSSISRARNSLAYTFLESDCTDFVFVDDDTVFDAASLIRLVAQASDLDVVAGAVPILKNGTERSYRFTPVGDNITPSDRELVEVDRVGTAFMCIRRHVFEKLLDKVGSYYVDQVKQNHHRFFSEEFDDGAYWGEDYFFCKNARDAGFRIWVDANMSFAHVKKIDLTGNFIQDLPGLKVVSANEDKPKLKEAMES